MPSSRLLSSRILSTVARPAFAPAARFSTPRFFHATRPAMTVHVVKTQDEFKSAVSSNKVVLVDCFAEWCGPCKAIAPLLEKHSNSEDFKDKVHFLKFDVDDIPDLTQELGVRAMPTFLLFKDGEKAEEMVGANPNGLVQLLKKHSE